MVVLFLYILNRADLRHVEVAGVIFFFNLFCLLLVKAGKRLILLRSRHGNVQIEKIELWLNVSECSHERRRFVYLK